MTYAKDLLKSLESHRDTDCVDIKEDIDELISMADSAVDQYDDLKDKYDDIYDEKDDLEDKVEELEGRWDGAEEVITQRSVDGILLKADNLLDQQLIEAFKECLEHPKINHLQFLQILQGMAKHGITKVNERAY